MVGPLGRKSNKNENVYSQISCHDVGQGYNMPKTGDQGQGNRTPDPQKRSCCKVRGLNPGVTKKIVHTIAHMITHTIMHTIVRIRVHIKAHMECTNKFHVQHVCWMADDCQTDG